MRSYLERAPIVPRPRRASARAVVLSMHWIPSNSSKRVESKRVASCLAAHDGIDSSQTALELQVVAGPVLCSAVRFQSLGPTSKRQAIGYVCSIPGRLRPQLRADDTLIAANNYGNSCLSEALRRSQGTDAQRCPWRDAFTARPRLTLKCKVDLRCAPLRGPRATLDDLREGRATLEERTNRTAPRRCAPDDSGIEDNLQTRAARAHAAYAAASKRATMFKKRRLTSANTPPGPPASRRRPRSCPRARPPLNAAAPSSRIICKPATAGSPRRRRRASAP